MKGGEGKKNNKRRGEKEVNKTNQPTTSSTTSHTHKPQSTVNHQSSIINHQSSIINHQSSIINHQSSIINHQSSIINHQPIINPIVHCWSETRRKRKSLVGPFHRSLQEEMRRKRPWTRRKNTHFLRDRIGFGPGKKESKTSVIDMIGKDQRKEKRKTNT